MVKYKIEIRKSAQREIESLQKSDLKAILKEIEKLSENPRRPGVIKLSGQEQYRSRVGRFRIVFEIHDSILLIIVVKVAHRKDIYR
jgi:mRNA interferase RelE/StbE